ncbi:MAG TPA: NAD-dependent epimerase/dehydratase family protein [Conexibacter sp.]|nr:NAD-dependent epimerase/dehydratase family protein [Conexibacter sp.]
MRVVVVGGTGNISTPLVHALAAAGHEVTVFVRGTRTRTLPEGVRVLHGDREDRAAFEELMRREAFDAAYDMICFTAEDAESDLRAFAGVGHFVHTSTISTFGGPLADLPATESTAIRPIAAYGTGKARADEVFLEAHRRDGFPVTMFKPAHAWGPGFPIVRQLAATDRHWIGRLRAGKPLLIAGDGLQKWCLCHSEDVAQGYLGVLGQPWAFGETYIITGPEPIDWLEYHRQIAEALDAPLRLVHAPVEDVLRVWPEGTGLLASNARWDNWYDVSKLQAAVPSFRPHLTLLDRIAEHVAWAEVSWAPEGPDREDEVLRELGLPVT